MGKMRNGRLPSLPEGRLAGSRCRYEKPKQPIGSTLLPTTRGDRRFAKIFRPGFALNSAEMKILHVIDSLTAGGAERLVSQLASKQSESMCVSVFTFMNNTDLFASQLAPEVQFVSCGKTSCWRLGSIWRLFWEIKRHDMIHVHLFPAFYFVAILSLFFPKKSFVVTEHSPSNGRRRTGFRWIEKYLIYRRFSSVVCISSAVLESLENWIGNRTPKVVIANFVDVEQVAAAVPLVRHEFGVDDDCNVMVMVGSFRYPKNQKTLILALNELPGDFHLVLVGDGPERQAAHQLVESLGLRERVHFLGVRQDVNSIVKACDYGILSSSYEGFGIAALEYMAAGIVALGTDVPGLRSLFSEKQNLFEDGDFNRLAERLVELNQKDTADIIGKQTDFVRSYDIRNSVNRHHELYRKLQNDIYSHKTGATNQ